MEHERWVKTSKRLSQLLRHGARERGLAMDEAGWAAVADVLRILGIAEAQLDEAIVRNDKRRFERDGDRVRACQGHSGGGAPVTLEALEASWSDWVGDRSLWHGTQRRAIPGVAAEGLRPIARTHVHLADALESKVGKRANVEVVLEIDPTRVRGAGLRLFAAPNGVVLARHVPPPAIVGLRALTRAARADEAALREVLRQGR